MTTRHDLVTRHAAEAVESLLAATSTNGGRPWFLILEESMHSLLRENDTLEHQKRDELWGRIGPQLFKGRKR